MRIRYGMEGFSRVSCFERWANEREGITISFRPKRPVNNLETLCLGGTKRGVRLRGRQKRTGVAHERPIVVEGCGSGGAMEECGGVSGAAGRVSEGRTDEAGSAWSEWEVVRSAKAGCEPRRRDERSIALEPSTSAHPPQTRSRKGHPLCPVPGLSRARHSTSPPPI